MKKSTGNLIVGGMFVGLIGAAAFLFTREAAAKNKAAEAFSVDMDCGSFLVLDEAKARSAFVAAAIAVAPSPDSNAIGALKAILTFMFPQCDWTDPPDGRTFVRGTGQFLRWGDIETAVGDRTVAELREFLDSIGVMQGSSPTETFPWLIAEVFGTGGCMDCALGTGGETRSKQGYHLAADLGKGRGGTGFIPPKPPSLKMPIWLPVDPPRHALPLYWVTLSGVAVGNIYAGILWTRSTSKKKAHTQQAVQVEVRILSDGSQEARILP